MYRWSGTYDSASESLVKYLREVVLDKGCECPRVGFDGGEYPQNRVLLLLSRASGVRRDSHT